MIQRIILSGGGTGGHIYPALSIYHRLKELNPQLECLYIGSQTGLEADIVTKANIPFEAIQIQGLKRSLSLENLKAIWYMNSSTRKVKRLIREFQPDVVVGTGGYVCAPVLYAAAQSGYPTLIHEQNSIPGLTNKFLSRYVDRIGICFQEAASGFEKVSHKVRLTGNPRGQEVVNYPMDSEILSKQYGLSDSLPTVLIFGGSRGAPAINQAAIQIIENLQGAPYQVIIGTGNVHYDDIMLELKQKHREIPDNVRILPYIENMPAVFGALDLVVCRSGATTLTELTALGLASILVPSPYVTSNHQYHNAMALVDKGAAVLIEEADLSAEKLLEQVNRLMSQPEAIAQMGQQAKTLGIVDATDRIIEVLNEIAE
ncbi:undecaprenyldiphospho-muramoylpentapeptide beta-N-acetylglucosaminyltransferase [Suicoccus acidiformans]|uniref:UDP-N-acetylglucosamine--N-acetylmuramyl-(pentapeptide) pyrophosphoryl-undecaprenol N-acetylglucosamine transferase n=1 Tax=Suicoccus acidiformans TaxID=2036206 RepID=A0A347WLL4_9LACT|nr:undecaprenyldiphospho-muramoylpentapeptide beta-N-acetylglucosaminyltransferase [Suicoccus acidiformans]AXY25971.1 undecaprenyldiphospho-muramoylpentapeptide beta-N-acetylglucosaminyltransferase [Suicoccus acidiformans]